MARPLPPVSPCAPWLCSGISTPTGLARAATPRLVALRSTTSMVSSITPTGSTTCSSPPPWEGENYEPRNPMESEKIIVFDSEGDLLMNLGILPTIAEQAPKNFYHFLLDNECYATTGGQPVPNAKNVAYDVMARGAGYPR